MQKIYNKSFIKILDLIQRDIRNLSLYLCLSLSC